MNDRRRNTVRIDYDKLAEAIVKAEMKVNDKLEQQKEAEHEKLQEEWNVALEIDENKSNFRNDLKVLKNIIIMKKEKAITLVANNLLLKTILIGVYRAFEFSLYILTVISIAIAIKFHTNVLAIGFGIFMLIIGTLFARIIRVARFEIDNIEDKSYLATLFAAVMSFVAIIISAVAIVISIIYKG